MIACIDGGLICIPVTIICILFPSVGGWLFCKWHKICKKSCKCDCHNKKSNGETDEERRQRVGKWASD